MSPSHAAVRRRGTTTSSVAVRLHARYVSAAVRLHARYVSAAVRLHARYVSAAVRLHARYVSAAVRLHARNESAAVRLHARYVSAAVRLHARYVSAAVAFKDRTVRFADHRSSRRVRDRQRLANRSHGESARLHTRSSDDDSFLVEAGPSTPMLYSVDDGDLTSCEGRCRTALVRVRVAADGLARDEQEPSAARSTSRRETVMTLLERAPSSALKHCPQALDDPAAVRIHTLRVGR